MGLSGGPQTTGAMVFVTEVGIAGTTAMDAMVTRVGTVGGTIGNVTTTVGVVMVTRVGTVEGTIDIVATIMAGAINTVVAGRRIGTTLTIAVEDNNHLGITTTDLDIKTIFEVEAHNNSAIKVAVHLMAVGEAVVIETP